ncbi:hypothetical protein FHR32_006258 [Streptosporangium album]|uniref:Uncharacterized protein n=1 Tax=Streptosporangium album TaxID=47479 RepID=A0A7W7S1K0_9ACTN|nr:hypothetical protein [Streptosporangium album]MBB4941872.1 hypothetical protein [Streptosporangium album]
MSSATYVEPAELEPEIALVGGDVTKGVVRIGDTVLDPDDPCVPEGADLLHSGG